MMKIYRALFALILPVLLSACAEDAEQTADEKLSAITSQPSAPQVMPLPTGAPVISVYQAGKDPFANPWRTQAKTEPVNDTASTQASKAESRASDQKRDKNTDDTSPKTVLNEPKADTKPIPKILGKIISIDDTRVREPLENYELSQLIYQGRISDHTRQIALVRSPDGFVHQLSVGRYIGRHHGLVTQITPTQIAITEAVLGDDGRYYERQSVMSFAK